MKAERQSDFLTPAFAELPPLRRRSLSRAIFGFVLCVLLPGALAGVYYYHIAADRYVSEFRYAVRGGPASYGAEGDAVSVSMGAGSALMAAADSFILEEYLRSPAVLDELEARLPLREMLGRDGGDPVRSYRPDLPPEELLDFWAGAINVRFDVVTGITTVAVKLFRPDDSQAVATALVKLLGRLVDRLSERARTEMLAYVGAEFALAEDRLRSTLDSIEAFRRDNELVSPAETAELGTTVIATLTGELTELRVRLRTLLQNVPDSPQIRGVTDRIASLEAQLANERAALGGRDPGATLPDQLTTFERLESEYQIARDSYISTLEMQQKAKAQATLSMAELVVFVPPRAAITSTEPVRWLEVLLITGGAFLVWLIARIFVASLHTP